MKKLASFTHADFFNDGIIVPPVEYERTATRAIIRNKEGKISLVGNEEVYFLLPGGAVEAGETLEQGLDRECMEEVGCTVKIITEIGFVETFRFKNRSARQENHCFVTDLIEEKNRTTTLVEEVNFQTRWVTVQEAIDLLKAQQQKLHTAQYHSHFNLAENLVMLEEYTKSYSS